MARDITVAVLGMLMDDEDVIAIVDDRLYGEELPEEECPNMPRGCVVVRRVSGFGGMGGDTEIEEGMLDVACYGQTPFDAMRLRLAVYNALKHTLRSVQEGTLIHSLESTAGASSLRDADFSWPLVLESWKFVASEVEAA